MTFKLPLETRRRLAADKKRRYWSNPAERLKRINENRARIGLPSMQSLDEVTTPSERAVMGVAARLRRQEQA